MAQAWHHVYSDDPDDQNAPHLEVEYRPGGQVEILAAKNGTVVNLVGMPYAAFEQMVRAITGFHADDETIEAEPVTADRDGLAAALRRELVNLWADFEHASRESLAPGAGWSMGQEWFLERIKALSDLVGPVSWRDISIPFLLSETYRAACERVGYPVAASDAELVEVRERWSAQVAGWRC